jgi:hypothetical protein
MLLNYEQLLLDGGVAVAFYGHVHAFERSCPVFNNTCMPPGEGIVHVTSGDGGAGLYKSWWEQPAWSVTRSAEWGHSEFTVLNETTAVFRWQRNADAEGTFADEAYITNRL